MWRQVSFKIKVVDKESGKQKENKQNMRPSLSFKLTSFSKLPISVKGIFICIFLYVRVYVCEVFANTKTLWKNFMDCVRQSYFDGYEHGVKVTATKDFLNLSESISQYEKKKKKEKSKENNKSIVPGAVPYYRSQGSLCCSCYSCRKGMNTKTLWIGMLNHYEWYLRLQPYGRRH